jgi:hypothetical protein
MKYRKSILSIIMIFVLFCVTPSQNLYSQDSIPFVKEYKNTIKGMAIVLPLFAPFIISTSLGYERYINPFHAVELTGSYFFLVDEMGYRTNIFSIKPGYNYYFKKRSDKGPYFRVGGFLKYSNRLINSWGNSYEIYGVGLIAGIRINISKSHTCFLDLAFGASFDYFIRHDEWFLDGNTTEWAITPRPVIHFSKRF